MPKNGVKMTDVTASNEIGERIADWLRRVYPRDGAKLAAQDFRASPHTTRRWFEGLRPKNKHFDHMVKKWGRRFVEEVYGLGETHGLGEEIARLRMDMDSLRIRLDGGPFSVGSSPMASREGALRNRRRGDLDGRQVEFLPRENCETSELDD